MNLDIFLKNIRKKESIALLFFQDEQLICEIYQTKDKIPRIFMKKEVMEIKQEDDCLEVWIN